MIICRCPFKDSPFFCKYLCVNESRNRGWWIPGGAVDAGQSFSDAATRECIEEAGVEVDLKGVLKIDYSVQGASESRMRVIFYAEPKSVEAAAAFKTVPDEESLEGRWFSPQELVSLCRDKTTADKLRGREMLHWASYIEKGGQIFPLSVIAGKAGQGEAFIIDK